MTDDTAKQWTAISAMAEVAAMMIQTAFMVPIGAMKAACGAQERAIELMESLLPGLDERGEKTSEQSAPPAAGATAGWGPVTPQTPVTGWGPMPR